MKTLRNLLDKASKRQASDEQIRGTLILSNLHNSASAGTKAVRASSSGAFEASRHSGGERRRASLRRCASSRHRFASSTSIGRAAHGGGRSRASR